MNLAGEPGKPIMHKRSCFSGQPLETELLIPELE